MTDNPLSFEEKTILTGFRLLDVPANFAVPVSVIGSRLWKAGYMGGAEPWKWESAYISLEVRGLITPGDGPLGAICWALTPRGHALINREGALA